MMLKSLCGFDDINERRDTVTVGVENSFGIRECSLPNLPVRNFNAIRSNQNKPKKEVMGTTKKKSGTKDVVRTSNFVPDWNHYDVMQHRWVSLLPATKRLITEVEEYMPTSSANNAFRVDAMQTPIQGRFL